MMVLFDLALDGSAGRPFPASGPVPLSINALAKKFSVSRKHVLTLLRDAEALELLARGGAANNEVTILPRARDGVQNLIAGMFLYLAESAEEAMARIGATAAHALSADVAG